MATKKSTRSRARRAPAEVYENPNTPVAPYDDSVHAFAERDEVEENPNTPVAPETPDAPNAIPFADRDRLDPTGGASSSSEAEE